MDEEQSEREAEGAEGAEGAGRTDGAGEPQDGQGAPKQPGPAAPDTPAVAPVHHNRVNQYFNGALDAPGAHFGIGVGDFANARRRAVGRLDAGEADALLAPYVEPGCFEE